MVEFCCCWNPFCLWTTPLSFYPNIRLRFHLLFCCIFFPRSMKRVDSRWLIQEITWIEIRNKLNKTKSIPIGRRKDCNCYCVSYVRSLWKPFRNWDLASPDIITNVHTQYSDWYCFVAFAGEDHTHPIGLFVWEFSFELYNMHERCEFRFPLSLFFFLEIQPMINNRAPQHR